MKNKIVILSGDPNSINSELIYKSWKKLNDNTKKKIYFISNYQLLKKQFQKLHYKIKIVEVDNLYERENDLNNSVESYQELLKLNNIIEKKFKNSAKNILLVNVILLI